MPSLYNCKHSGDQYKITKFDSDFNVEASYLCDLSACECPAGHRPKCRHREMLPKFIARNAVGTEWFLDHDRGGWVQGWKEGPVTQYEEPEGLDEDVEGLASEALLIENENLPSGLQTAIRTPVEVPTHTLLEALPIQQMIIEPKTFDEVLHEHDEEQLAFYRAAAGLPIQPSTEPAHILGGFPDWCLNSECTTPNDCILFGCAHDHGTPPRSSRSLAPTGLGQVSEQTPSTSEIMSLPQYNNIPIREVENLQQLPPSPSPTIRRRV